MKAVIMAGGMGTRLRPLTESTPKPMLPVCNRPVMEYTLALLKSHGIDTAIVTLHYRADDIISYFGDGSDFGLKIIYSIEDEPLGTAGSVKKVQEELGGETFIVISGDGLTDIELGRAIAFHKDKQAVATLVLMAVSNPLEYGVVITNKDGAIEKFLEKPSWGEVFSDQVNTGIYVLDPSILDLMEPDREYDFSRDIFPKLLENGDRLYGNTARGYWCDIGDIDRYAAAHRDMFKGKVLQEMAGKSIAEGVWIGEGTKVDPTAVLEAPLMIGRNCRIGAHAYISSYTCIGDNCIIEEHVNLQRDIILNNVFIGSASDCKGAIICRQCTIKSGVTLNDSCIIGENVLIGRGAVVNPGIKIWRDKNIPDGATVTEELEWGSRTSETIFGRDSVTGLGNLEISPEFAMKLGAAFGTTLPKNSTIVVSRDSHRGSRLIKRALISGLSSVGVNVQDLRLRPVVVSRYIAKNDPRIMGGVHTRVYRDDARQLEIEFFDGQGMNIDKIWQRKVENSLIRQSFRRTSIDEVGEINYLDECVIIYTNGFIRHVDIKSIKDAHFKIVIDYSYGAASQVLPFILNGLGVKTISLSAYVDSDKAREFQEKRDDALQQLSSIVNSIGANLGIIIDADAERIYVVDENGVLIRGTNLLALIALMVFRSRHGANVSIPTSIPSIVDKLATKEGGHIIRTKTDYCSIMRSTIHEGITMAGTSSGAFIFPEFSYGFDAMFLLAKILEMMAYLKQPLSEIVKAIPPHYSFSGHVNCNWSDKAKVMRLIKERYRDEQLEHIDGVRINFNDGSSVLMAPHPSLPRISVWSDASNKGRARALMERAKFVIPQLANADEAAIMSHKQKDKDGANISPTTVISEERAFKFWVPGRSLGIQVRSLRSFVEALHSVEAASLEYHMDRNDFASWLRTELGRPLTANELEQVGKARYRGEELRRHILECFDDESRAYGYRGRPSGNNSFESEAPVPGGAVAPVPRQGQTTETGASPVVSSHDSENVFVDVAGTDPEREQPSPSQDSTQGTKGADSQPSQLTKEAQPLLAANPITEQDEDYDAPSPAQVDQLLTSESAELSGPTTIGGPGDISVATASDSTS